MGPSPACSFAHCSRWLIRITLLNDDKRGLGWGEVVLAVVVKERSSNMIHAETSQNQSLARKQDSSCVAGYAQC